MILSFRDSLFSLLYPQQCRVCCSQVESHGDGVACAACWASTRLFNGSEMLCDKCGAYLGDRAAPIPVLCRKCDDHHYERATAAGVYENALAATIVSLKNTPTFTRRLRTTLSAAIKLNIVRDADLIIPIPLSAGRRIERGFNQADLIADAVSSLIGVPIDSHSLARKVHTPIHRMGMDQKARELSVKTAFEVVRPKLLAGKNILLVDDVLTSGATASSCAKALKKSGAGNVNVFTLARAVMH